MKFGPAETRQDPNHPRVTIVNKLGKSTKWGHGVPVVEVISELQDDHLVFEARMDSPYLHSLAGEYDMGMEPVEILNTTVSGICPICNNRKRRKIEKMYLAGTPITQIGRASGASPSEVKSHFRHHFAGIHSAIAVALSGVTDAEISELKNDYKKYQNGPDDSDHEPFLTGQMPDHPGLADVPKIEYAMDGDKQLSPLRPWMKSRAKMELETKLEEAINFYDEMLECRNKARRVFNEIMDAGDIKYYSTAIAAIREQRGVVETLGKMSLIAKSLSDGKPMHGKNMSPELRDLMQKLGIEVKNDSPPLEAPPQAMDEAVMESGLGLDGIAEGDE